MIAKIKRENNILTAIYERQLNHPVNEVWAYLTENIKLQQWFPELKIQELKKEGEIWFDLQDGNHEKMTILHVVPEKVFTFTWDKNTVSFALDAKENGCLLVFKEYLNEITAHTPKDLAGWHVCLDVIEALLNEQSIDNRKAHWEKWYPKYQEAIQFYLK